MPRRQFTDVIGASGIFGRARSPIAHDAETPIFQSEINPDPFSPSASRRDDQSLPRLAGSPPSEEVDPYRLSSASGSERDASHERDHEDDADVMRRERTHGRPGAGWWVHQSVLPSAAASRASGRSYRGRRRRPRDLDDVYASDEDASDSGTGSSKPSDPPSPRTEGTLSRSIAPPRRRRSASITDTQSETDSDYSSSGSSFASTSTASALSRSSPDSRTLDPQRSRSRREESMRDPEEEEGEVMQDVPQRLEVFQDPFGHWRARGKGERYRDSPFLALWSASLMGILVGLCFVWGSTTASPIPPGADPEDALPSPGNAGEYRTPFTTLLHTIPLLAGLLLVAVAAPFALLFLLRKTVRPVLIGTAVAVPFLLICTSWWAFIASFEIVPSRTGTDAEPNWWGTTGLRWCAGIPLVLAGLSTMMVWRRRRRLQTSVAVVEIATSFLIEHPILLLITPALLVVFSLISIPFLALVLRLLLVGYYRHPREHTYIWHVRPYAGWLIALVTLLWLWTWVIVRGIGRVVLAAVLGEWYFHRPELKDQQLVEVTVAAVQRATGSNLGSICLSSLIVAVARMVGKTALTARRITHPRANVLPGPLMFLKALTPLFTLLAGVLDFLNGYALVYVGVTGEAFWPSAKRAVRLAGKRHQAHLMDYTLVKLLLTLCSTTVAIGTATAGYLYATHTLSAPAHAPLAGFLCGGVVFLAVRAGMAVLADTSDALFICYAIDREVGGRHNEKIGRAFSGEVDVRLNESVV
ncbi:hypothetical protein NCC49_003121 [Naganishia albida]|nr:hypothetical protein NCC49_003121 [Naganishia albida]